MNDLDLCLEVESRSCQPLGYIRRWISRKPLEIEAWFLRTTPPIGNGIWAIKWSRDRWRRVTLKGKTRDPNTLSAQYLENGWIWRLRSKGPPIGNGIWAIKWSRDRWRHVTLKGKTRDPNTLSAQYLENGWIWRLRSKGPPIAWHGLSNTWPMTSRDPRMCETVRSAILATAWLLVFSSRRCDSLQWSRWNMTRQSTPFLVCL